MSLAGIQDLDVNWTLRNSLTINNNVEVLGGLNTTGFIYDGGIPVGIEGTNNVWTGKNTYTTSLPTYLDPTSAGEMATKKYMDTTLTGLGTALLASNNTWTGSNVMVEIPTITNSAAVPSSQLVNKSQTDTYIGSQTGTLGSTNTWTKVSTAFQNVVSVPAPGSDLAFANKKYVDDTIAAFNASGGKIEYVEVTAQGDTFLSCDPAIYSGCIFALVGSGGYGSNTNPPIATGQSIKSYGGAGGYAVCKLPAYAGTCRINIQNNTRTLPGTGINLYLPSGLQVIDIQGAANGNISNTGQGADVKVVNGMLGVQSIKGLTEPLQNPITDDTITKVINLGCQNGYGMGGSFNYQNGIEVPPSSAYCLQIKFKN